MCTNKQQVLCDNIKCRTCLPRSVASHEISKYWSIENKIQPRKVLLNSKIKYIFYCPYCNCIYIDSPNNIIYNHEWCWCRLYW